VLTFDVTTGYQLTITQFNFWSQRSNTGATDWLMTINGVRVGAGLIPTTGAALGNTNVASVISGLTGTVTVQLSLSGASGSGTFRLDDFTLFGSVTPLQSYFRSRQSGNWSSPSTWEYSTDNVNWNISSKAPTKDVESILIQPGHTVSVASSVSLDQTTIAGTLELQTGGVLNINDGAGDDITIPSNGILKITSTTDYSTCVQQSSNADINIASGGKITIGDGTSSTGNGYEAFATSTTNVWNDGAIFEYNIDKPFQAPGLVYFPNAISSVIPIFRVIKVSGTPGIGSTKNLYVNGILEVNTNLTFSGTGDKYLRNGVRGTSILTVTGTGELCVNGANAILAGPSLYLVLNTNHNLQLLSNSNIPTGAKVTISGANIDNNLVGNVFTINGTLDVTDKGVKNTNGTVILNGTFKTANTGGFSGTGSSIVSGNIFVNPGSTIELYANGNQSLNGRTDFKDLIFSGSGIKTPNGPFSPTGTITIKDDAVFDCTGNSNGTNIGNSNTNLTMSDNSRLIVSSVGQNPPMAGSYNLSGGVIEFRGSNGTPQTIRSKSYQNIEVTGNNVSMSDGNITLNTNGIFRVKSGGVFTINDNTINGPNGTQTIIVESGGYFKCGTNKGFNGFTITSAPIKSSAINSDIENIILEPNSTVEYSRSSPPLSDGDQPITNANGLIYQNLVISGSGNKTAPADNLIIQGNLTKSGMATFVHNNGTVIFNGTKEQIYSSNSPQMVFNNLANANKKGLFIKDSLSVYNQLSMDNSSTTLDADISLLSSKNNTASIGRLSANANINYNAGRFIVERYINTSSNGGHQKSWQLLSTPAFGETVFNTWQEKGSATIAGYGTWITGPEGTSNGFDAQSPGPSIKNYDAASNSWTGIVRTDILLQNEKGYMIFIRGDRLANNSSSAATPTVLRTRGKLYCTEFPPPKSVVPAGKFQSVGNPYASTIDFEKISFSNIGSNYIAWDPTLGGIYGFGGYQTIAAATDYAAVPGGTSTYSSTGNYQYIQSGQAFFVSNYTNTDGFVSFSEDCKTSGKYHMVNREYENDKGILFANLFSKNGIVIDGNAVSFSGKFSNKIDGDDVTKFGVPAESFAVKRMDKLLTVEAREEIKVTDTIVYSLRNLIKQDYTIILYTHNIQSSLDAYLVDCYLRTERQINLSDSSVISFSVTDDKASSNPDRFYLVFRAAAGPLAVSFVSMNAHLKDENVLIEWKVENEKEIKDYEVEYSTDGIYFTPIGVVSASDGVNKNYNFIHFRPLTGNAFYRIKIDKINGESEYQKVLKVIVPSSISAIHIYPNPVQAQRINLQFVKQPLGKYRFVLHNSLGQKVLSKEIIYSGETHLSLNCSRILTAGMYQLEIIKPNGERESLKVKSE